jgi:hypothetical protein
MSRGLAELRRLLRQRRAGEHCELCAAPLAERHEHLVNPRERRLACACTACAILFDGTAETPYRRVPRDIVRLPDSVLSDETWNGLAIPIGLAFLFRSSVSEQIAALYPSPAGPTETILEEAAFVDTARLRPDVEALLINRLHGARDYYVAPIDECYRLTGIIRTSWRGLSGGDEAAARIRDFFSELDRRARPAPVEAHA